jgi:hypothetical protein
MLVDRIQALRWIFVMSMLDQIRAILTTTPTRWQTLLATLPPELAERPPKHGEWSALECLRHLTDAEKRLWPVRVRAFLSGQGFPHFAPTADISEYRSLTSMQLADEFARLRAVNLPLLDSVTEADFARPGTHPALGPVTFGQMLNVWAGHDLMHTVQAERALMQPFIAATGAWRGAFFTDHDVDPPESRVTVMGK